ncbi:hypothetical protein EV383_5697 [Pseudonocardia sediminis]|uniref:Uncharacterized protein n=2 Tax=Pseudonocardia sediminis TaxID=1397368 RepID=A0A4Q7V2G2_PSEST|nr:hypothetical protein EV383_5697 [Pseudonocardia sediminis]
MTWDEPTAPPSYRCSDPSCQQVWHHRGTSLPFAPVPDGRGGMAWHPCPQCADEGPAIVAMTHRVRSRASADLALWGTALD